MSVSSKEMAEHVLGRARERADCMAALRERIRAELPRVVDLLRTRYGVRRVLLFGSVARGEIHERSDVDLAVEGLDPAEFFRAAGECMDLLSLPIDLIPLEAAPPGLRERIEREGEDLDGPA
ncbi:MAG: nucleotidyltransferase domain-containing protein [Planctomycetes bacterium]|nr:nucleotidyltransferase domain-containing protein [Planctomycetota bacterium]